MHTDADLHMNGWLQTSLRCRLLFWWFWCMRYCLIH